MIRLCTIYDDLCSARSGSEAKTTNYHAKPMPSLGLDCSVYMCVDVHV